MEEQEILEIIDPLFWSHTNARVNSVKNEHRRFVHYTSTEAALSIINNKEIWLRNSSVMNDYSEMAHGEACVRYCLFDNDEVSSRSRVTLNGFMEGLHDRVVQWFVQTSQMRRAFTYLLSISEHGPPVFMPGMVDEESYLGRLSMWRAYGSSGGVALIFGQEALMSPNNVLDVFSSPVFYGNPDAFAHEYCKVLNYIEQNRDQVLKLDPDLFWENFQRFLHFSILACKHPGFAEEREWRVTYSANPGFEDMDDDTFNAQSKIKREFRSINGVPQRIYKIPFANFPDEGLTGLTLPEILKTVVIGPTQFPFVVHDALAMALFRAGFGPDNIEINLSQIPLRT